jgi:uncharacterized membrane protein (DUF485 family)
MTLEEALSLCARLAAFSILISSVELLFNRQLLREDGLLSWSVARLRDPALAAGRSAPFWNAVSAYPNIVAIHAATALIAVSVAVGPRTWSISPVPALALYAASFIGNVRTHYGHDGADQLAGFIVLSIGISGLAPASLSRIACIGFLAFQACLAYAAAGWAKLPQRGWRDGTYLAAIVSTRVYGTPPLGRFLASHRPCARAATLAVLAWECTFPLVLVLPAPFAYAMLAAGVLFHVTNAVVMGLNTFVWSFVATYPAVLWVVQHRGW